MNVWGRGLAFFLSTGKVVQFKGSRVYELKYNKVIVMVMVILLLLLIPYSNSRGRASMSSSASKVIVR